MSSVFMSLHKDIKNLVRKTVEETLNALLDEEASELVGAECYVKTAGRDSYRSCHYARKLVTGAGEVEISVLKFRGATFQMDTRGTRPPCLRTCSQCCGWRGAFMRFRASRCRPLTACRACVQGYAVAVAISSGRRIYRFPGRNDLLLPASVLSN